jgi:glycosyltransferase involved in cell wall biosynthesis
MRNHDGMVPLAEHAPPRALFVIDSLRRNGALTVTVELARQWAPMLAQIAVLQRPRELPEWPLPAGVHIKHLTTRPARLRRALISALARLTLVSRDFEVVVSGSEIGVGLVAGYLVARLTRRPFIIAVHADLDQALVEWVPAWLHRLFYKLHRQADGAICVAPSLVDALVKNGLAPDRIRVVQNGVDLQAIRQKAQEPCGLVSGDVPVVVASGRLAPQKGYDLLLRAHREVVDRLPHRVLIINDGPERASLEALADKLRVSDSVQFAGAVRSPLPTVANASLFCLPSRHEGFPLALLEAITLGVPIIAADCSEGVRKALDDGRIGDLVPVGDVSALAKALESFLEDQTALRQKAMLGPDHACHFDSRTMAFNWAAALRELVGKPRRRGLRRSRTTLVSVPR